MDENERCSLILYDYPFQLKDTAANISDNQAGILGISLLRGKVPRLKNNSGHGL